MSDKTGSHWRITARSIIKKVIKQYPELVTKDGLPKLFKHVSKQYPWGERKMHPYKMWLKEVGIARRALERDVGLNDRHPLFVKCPACGARPALECAPVGSVADDLMVAKDAEEDGRTEDAERIRNNAFHRARLVAVGLAVEGDTLPLFGVDL